MAGKNSADGHGTKKLSGTRKRDSEQFPREDASVGSTEMASVSSDVISGGKG